MVDKNTPIGTVLVWDGSGKSNIELAYLGKWDVDDPDHETMFKSQVLDNDGHYAINKGEICIFSRILWRVK